MKLSVFTRPADFQFLDPGRLEDAELKVLLDRKLMPDGSVIEVPTYRFHLFVPGIQIFIGHVTLRIGNTPNLALYQGHIGYGVQGPWRGRRYAARATKLMFPLARAHGFRELWITCDPDNHASRRTCELVGGVYVETLDVPPQALAYRHGARRKCRFRVDL